MVVQFDLIHSGVMRENPDLFFSEGEAQTRTLAELVSPLVIEADGRVVPYEYGFAAPYALGSLTDADLPALAARWRGCGYRELQKVCRGAFEDAAQMRELPILNWWEKLGEYAAVNA